MSNYREHGLLNPTASSKEVGSLGARLRRFPWGLMVMLLMVAGAGLVSLYSAVGGQAHLGLVVRQVLHLLLGILLMVSVGLANDKIFMRYAYLMYGGALLLLVTVFVAGTVGMGARRWLDLGVMRLQPSELMKVGLVLGLARYFHDRSVAGGLRLRDVLPALLIIAVPLGFIVKQPDLGTAVLLAAIGGVVVFVAGLPWKMTLLVLVGGASSIPLAWNLLHDYQRKRIQTLLNPEADPLGSGYHIIQSKIAVGSGGLTGKGFMAGSQTHLDFLPERHTDFIFSVFSEEWGFLGGAALLFMYALITVRGMVIAFVARDRFGLLLAVGVMCIFTLQAIINLGMVIGLLPVVGLPLPLMSYGGSSMITMMVAMGLLANVQVNMRNNE